MPCRVDAKVGVRMSINVSVSLCLNVLESSSMHVVSL